MLRAVFLTLTRRPIAAETDPAKRQAMIENKWVVNAHGRNAQEGEGA